MVLAPKKIKKSKIKQRRRRIALLIIILLILFLLYLIFHARNYEKKYHQNDFEIIEKFDKEKKLYFFEIKKGEDTWEFLTSHKYITKHKLIQEIELKEAEDTKCIIIKSEQLTTYPQCVKDGEMISHHLVSDDMKKNLDESLFSKTKNETKTYEKIDIKNIDDNTYYIWNYKGFYRINKNKQENINLFNKDIYDITSVASVANYLVIPDYTQSYYFNKFHILNMQDGKVSTWEFKDSLYFDGYYLGTYKNSLFYMDKKTKIEWEVDPKKQRMRKVGTETKEGKIYQNGDWEKVNVTKIINDNSKFITEEIYHYEIEDGLYVSYLNQPNKKKISNNKVKEIVAIVEDTVYYIVGHSLYSYSEATGENEILSYFEWNFNYKNMIFIQKGN